MADACAEALARRVRNDGELSVYDSPNGEVKFTVSEDEELIVIGKKEKGAWLDQKRTSLSWKPLFIGHKNIKTATSYHTNSQSGQ